MKPLLNRLGLVLIVACAGWLAMGVSLLPIARSQDLIQNPQAVAQPKPETTAVAPAAPEATLASVNQLESDAFKALRGSNFDRSSDLLSQAASLSHDPIVQRMATWTKAFQEQEQGVSGERHKQFEKAVADAHLLLDHKMDSYAIDELARAYSLSDTKDEFRHEKWVDDLVKESAATADQCEADEQWLKARNMYIDLGIIEPSSPEWKDKLKLATRRVRLLADYTSDRLKKLVESEQKERVAADKLLHPTTEPSATQPSAMGDAATQPSAMGQATSQPSLTAGVKGATTEPVDVFSLGAGADKSPTTQPVDEVASGSLAVDWHDASRGIEYDMLWDALILAEQQYYRDASFQTLLEGGLTGLRAVVTTKGLEDAFPGLGNEDKRQQFLKAIDSCLVDAAKATADNAQDTLDKSLAKLKELNTQTVNLPVEIFVREFADGAFAQLDPFSTMIWPYDLEEFQKTTQGEFGGVGIQIRQEEGGELKVVSPLEETPAYRAGIKAGDIITRINGKNAKGISLDRAVKTIMGAPGTTVNLTIRSIGGAVTDHLLKRELIKVATITGYSHKPGGGWDWFIDPEQHVAYIHLSTFSKNTADDLEKALDDLKDQHAKAVILDLRYNPGGLLQSATEVVNKFVPQGVIVSTKADRATVNQPTEMDAQPDKLQTDLPLVVLVNQYSASASEIVSGALKDHHRAMIVGERTYGKGSVQMLLSLDTKKAYLKLTTSHYYLPNGKCIHREENSTSWGVDPDVTVELTPEQMTQAIQARQEMDILRDAGDYTTTMPSTQPGKKDLLGSDPQLSAALLILRLELNGAQI
jgi:carboxyl-terminal processing protease